jgi:peptidoglycan/xylan/chitin deacetylase (PgdA/CDA1 family)
MAFSRSPWGTLHRLLTPLALLALLALSPFLAACSHGRAGASATPRHSASARPSSSATASVLKVKAVGPSSALLHSARTVRFAFRFVDGAPAQWNWRVVGVYGGVMASGVEEGAAGAATGKVTWDCTGPDGATAAPGEYLVTVGPGKSPTADATTVAWVRFEPPVKARVYRSLPAAGRRVALTFDDGGGKTAWYWILRELRDSHAKGTFFPIGLYVGDYARNEARLTLKDHMAIGSHTWSHADLTSVSDAEVRAQLVRADGVWWDDFRASVVPYLRPPGGAYNSHVLALAGRLGYSRIVLWDVDSLDWTNPGVKAIVHNVLDHVHNGSIVLMHTRGQTPNALPLIIAGLKARHYQMVTVPELFKAAGMP